MKRQIMGAVAIGGAVVVLAIASRTIDWTRAQQNVRAASSAEVVDTTASKLASSSAVVRLSKAIHVISRARRMASDQEANKTAPEPAPPPPVGRNPEFEQLLDSEPENVAWQKEMTDAFAQTYADNSAVKVQSCRCGEWFCRLELTTPDTSDGQRGVFDRIQTIKSLDGMLTLKVKDDVNPPVAIMYFSKKGTTLPYPQGS